MCILADGVSQTLEDLKTLYNIYCNGNISVFSSYAEEKFGKDKKELLDEYCMYIQPTFMLRCIIGCLKLL